MTEIDMAVHKHHLMKFYAVRDKLWAKTGFTLADLKCQKNPSPVTFGWTRVDRKV